MSDEVSAKGWKIEKRKLSRRWKRSDRYWSRSQIRTTKIEWLIARKSENWFRFSNREINGRWRLTCSANFLFVIDELFNDVLSAMDDCFSFEIEKRSAIFWVGIRLIGTPEIRWNGKCRLAPRKLEFDLCLGINTWKRTVQIIRVQFWLVFYVNCVF